MALDLNQQGHLINYPKKEWTCNDISELPVESDSLDIPNGSLCTLCKKPNYIIFAYDDIAKEWFEI
jgi:hypothetical protein